MLTDERLREKLRKIEALYAGAATPGEKAAAGEAAERIRRQFEAASKKEVPEEYKFSVPDPLPSLRRQALPPSAHAPSDRHGERTS